MDFAGGDAEDLVGGGVEVVKGVDAVAPLWGPAVRREGLLHGGGEGVGGGAGEGGAVEQNGEAGVVGHPAVGLEEEVFGFAGSGGGRGVWPPLGGETGGEEGGGELAAVDGGHGSGALLTGVVWWVGCRRCGDARHMTGPGCGPRTR